MTYFIYSSLLARPGYIKNSFSEYLSHLNLREEAMVRGLDFQILKLILDSKYLSLDTDTLFYKSVMVAVLDFV